jgi:glutathione S-transferase
LEIAMDLYFSPLACSLASRIALYEAGAADASYIEVDPKAKRTLAGDDYRALYPLGLVPLMRLDDGSLLSENAAILQYIAVRYPEAGLGAGDDIERAKLQQWLCFIGTELHKGLFIPLFDQGLSEDAKARFRAKGESRLAYLDNYLRRRDFLLDHFSVADAYLYTVLNWSASTEVDLAPWTAITAYYKRLQARPSIARAFKEELALYQAEQIRHQAA